MHAHAAAHPHRTLAPVEPFMRLRRPMMPLQGGPARAQRRDRVAAAVAVPGQVLAQGVSAACTSAAARAALAWPAGGEHVRAALPLTAPPDSSITAKQVLLEILQGPKRQALLPLPPGLHGAWGRGGRCCVAGVRAEPQRPGCRLASLQPGDGAPQCAHAPNMCAPQGHNCGVEENRCYLKCNGAGMRG